MKKKVLIIVMLLGFVLFGVTERTPVNAYGQEEEKEIGPECNLCRVTFWGNVIFGCKPAEGERCSDRARGATVSCENAREC